MVNRYSYALKIKRFFNTIGKLKYHQSNYNNIKYYAIMFIHTCKTNTL